MKIASVLLVLSLIAGFAATARAESDTMKGMEGMEGMDHSQMGSEPSSGDADVDFAEGMVVHHRSAVEMAKVELEKGTDPEMRKLAEEIIKSQNAEIDFMNAWLSKHKKN